MTTGASDLNATGTLENVIPFVVADEVLKGDFKFNAQTFKVSDFMVASAEETVRESESSSEAPSETTQEGVIPSFVDFTSAFNANKVIYDNLELTNAKGLLAVKDQKAQLQDVSADFFNGSIGMTGELSTQNATPSFDFELDLDHLDICLLYTSPSPRDA